MKAWPKMASRRVLREWVSTSKDGGIFDYETESMRITVHRHIHYPPHQWLLSCRECGFDKFELTSGSLDSAKSEALARVAERLDVLLHELGAP